LDEPLRLPFSKLVVGMLGWSSQNIAINTGGHCWFPTGPEDPRYNFGYVWEKHFIHAVENIRAFKEVIVIDEIGNVTEHTPIEAKILGYSYDDYSVQAYTGIEIGYLMGTAAQASDATLPANWIAERMYLTPTTNCLVRFVANTRVQHLLIANIQYFYQRRCREIFIQRQAVNGSLTIRALGNEVGL